MKKIAVFLFMFLILCLSVFAEDVEYEIRLSHNAEQNVVSAQVYISRGNSIAGHIGISYNSDKLYSVTSDFKNIPAEVPETGNNGASYLCDVVKSSAEHIIITPEMVKVKDLVNAEKSHVLFGWYAHKDVDSIKAGESVATVFFKLKDGVSISDITTDDISPASKNTTGGLTGWGSGIMVADSSGKQYFYEPAEGANKVKITVKADFTENEQEDLPEKEEPEESQNNEPEENNDEKQPENNENKPETGNDTLLSTDLAMVVRTFDDKIRVLWNKPSGFSVKEYKVVITDKDNNTVRIVEGITDVTRSFTVKNLANDYDFKVKLVAVRTDGAEVFHNKVAVLKTKSSATAQAKIYNVTYDAGNGTLYGIEAEQVLFGSTPTKAPTVYAPEGYEFSGWSLDGKTVIDIEKVKVYSDTVFKAVFTNK